MSQGTRELNQETPEEGSRQRMFDRACLNVRLYAALPRDWDTYDGLAASPQAVQFSCELLEALRTQTDIALPQISPISGGVYFEWCKANWRLYFEVDEDSVLFVVDDGYFDREDGEDRQFDVAWAVDVVKQFHAVDMTKH